jgi:hypothetical protein
MSKFKWIGQRKVLWEVFICNEDPGEMGLNDQ